MASIVLHESARISSQLYTLGQTSQAHNLVQIIMAVVPMSYGHLLDSPLMWLSRCLSIYKRSSINFNLQVYQLFITEY